MIESFVQDILAEIGQLPQWLIFFFFFVSAVLQIVFPPYPGDSVLIFGGCIASGWVLDGKITVLLAYFLGTVVSSCLVYELSARKGEKILETPLVHKFFSPANQGKAKKRVEKYGVAMLVICKFIPGINTLVIAFSGIFRFKRPYAYSAMAFAVAVHNVLWFRLGRVIGSNWGKIARFLSTYNKYVMIILVTFILLYAGFKVWMAARRKKVPGA